MLYSKNGSIPKPETDGTEGWIEVPDAPECPAGKEVVWWYPPGWVIRDPKSEDREGFVWKWSQSTEEWVEYALPNIIITANVESNVLSISSSDISSLSTSQIVMLQ